MNDKRRRDDNFVRNVLNQTSGSPCQRAAGLLPGLVDRELETLDRQLVQAHLEHCEGCRAVALALGWLGTLLPDMAEVDPGPSFTAAVLAKTSRSEKAVENAVRSGATIGPAGLMDRLGRWWEKQILKPQFALQFAYVATVVLVLLTALPVSPLRGTPEKALDVMQAGPGSVPVFREATQWVDDRADGAIGHTRSALGRRIDQATVALDRRNSRSREPRQELVAHLREAGIYLRAGELGEAGYELMQTAQSGKNAWVAWWVTPVDSTEARSKAQDD